MNGDDQLVALLEAAAGGPTAWPSWPSAASRSGAHPHPHPAEEVDHDHRQCPHPALRLTCRRCHRTWTATYQVGTFTDDAGDHEVYFRNGASATAPGSTRCPHCGGLRVVVLPSRAE